MSSSPRLPTISKAMSMIPSASSEDIYELRRGSAGLYGRLPSEVNKSSSNFRKVASDMFTSRGIEQRNEFEGTHVWADFLDLKMESFIVLVFSSLLLLLDLFVCFKPILLCFVWIWFLRVYSEAKNNNTDVPIYDFFSRRVVVTVDICSCIGEIENLSQYLSPLS